MPYQYRFDFIIFCLLSQAYYSQPTCGSNVQHDVYVLFSSLHVTLSKKLNPTLSLTVG